MDDAATAPMDWQAQIDQLSSMSDEDLAALEAQMLQAYDAADAANDTETAAAIGAALEQVQAEMDSRGAPAEAPGAAAPAPVPAAAVTADGADDTPDEQPAEAEPPGEAEPAETSTTTEATAEEETEPQTEEGDTVATSTNSAVIEVPTSHEPVIVIPQDAPSVVLAGADLPGVSVGARFEDSLQFGTALANRIASIARSSGGDGEQLMVASIQSSALGQDARTLSMFDLDANRAKIEAVTHLDAVTAAGGMCAPLSQKYTLFDIGGVEDRPVRDTAMAGFIADRGGIRYYPSPTLSDIGGAVGFWTSAQDAAALNNGGPTKVCARIACPAATTAEIQAVTMCLTFGVMQTRVFPELAASNTKLAKVAHARLAESALLAQIKAGSRQASETSKLSVTRDILDSIARVVIYFRDRHRLGPSIPLHAIFPVWLLEVLRGDIAMGEPEGSMRQSLSMSDSDIQGFFADRKINVTWALDSATPGVNGGGFMGPSSSGIPAWPTSLEWALYPEGTWLFLDGGTLDVGVVRDSALVKTNDYMQFMETFESAAKVGGESFWVTQQIKLTGMYQGPRVDPALLAQMVALTTATDTNA